MPTERSWTRAARDAAPVLIVLALCPIVAALAPGPAAPLDHVHELIRAERSLGLFFEPSVYAWVLARPPLMHVAELAYVGVHLPLTLGVLGWVWYARPHAFRLARNTFVGAQLLAVIGYVVMPTAPPLMVRGLGYDGAVAAGEQGFARIFQSPYAAMPSGHAAFALVVAGIVVTLARPWPVRLAALVYPVAVLAEILGTGNHLWIDAAAGAVAAALGFAFARLRALRGPRSTAYAEPARA